MSLRLPRARHLLALAALLGCELSPAPAPAPAPAAPPSAPPLGPSATPPPPPSSELDLRGLVVDADRRQVSAALRAALEHPDPTARRAAARALARAHAPDELRLFQRALRDPDPEVRTWASLGLGALEDHAPEAAVRVLASALAAEPDPALRRVMLRDLVRLGRDQALPAVEAALRAEHPLERAGGCTAAGELGLTGRDVSPSARSRLAALLGPTESSEVRLACAFALARLPVPPDPGGELAALSLAVADPDPEVRAFAYRALGRHPTADPVSLAPGTRDPDWRVAVQAFRALAARAASPDAASSSVGLYARALDAAAQQTLAEGDVASGGPLHVLLAALEAGAPIARAAPVHEAATRLLRQLGAPASDTEPSRDRGLAHCAAAELVDRGRGWPSRLDTCGLQQVLPSERRVRSATVLGALEGAEEPRVALLARLVRDPEPVVRISALAAAARIWHPDATALVLAALADPDPGVLAAASDALATVARRAPTEDRVPPPLNPTAAAAALADAAAHLAAGELETLIHWLDAVDATAARALQPRVAELALHPSHAVRHRARAVLAGWQAPLPPGPVSDPPNPITSAALLDPAASPRVRLETDRGTLILELLPDRAPVTVARFLELVRAGGYDGLSFHRVVPGFVTQGGDPRGDGYGGPGFWQRCEDHRFPYVRGTVGMALAGRDTGGSQFFIAHGAQPHLEARYTAFAQVVEGLEALDRLQAGDRIRRALVVE